MFIPFVSHFPARASRECLVDPDDTNFTSHPDGSTMYLIFVKESRFTHPLERRKGGGGGGSGKGPSSSSSGSRGSGSKSGNPSKVPLGSGSLPNGKKSATSYGTGGGRAAPIPLGRPFAGRIAGGGNRDQVYGNSIYGSGYPNTVGARGVEGLGFPFFFWPVVWPGPAIGAGSYLHNTNEYGLPENSSRPGGPLATAQFQSKNTGSTFYVLSDESTISSLIGAVNANCSSSLNLTSTSSSPTPFTNLSTGPLPEQALQYYRASSVVLTLDGYNDTAALNGTQNPSTSGPTAPPPNGTDTTLLTCLNETIGLAVPLVDTGARSGPPGMYPLVLAWVLVGVTRSLL